MLLHTNCEGCRGTLGIAGCPKHGGQSSPLAGGYRITTQPKQGWVCPKCQMVMAPWMPNCTNCRPVVTVDGQPTEDGGHA